jgi:hypothetical protein
LELLGGRFIVSGRGFDNVIPMPLIDSGRVILQLQGRNHEILIDGEGIEANLVGPMKYLALFPGAKGPKT